MAIFVAATPMSQPRISNTRVLVTGGAGFIGSSLCEDLLEYGNEVVCFDNFSTGKRSNVSELLTRPGFELMEGDIRNPADCRRAVEGAVIVLHQAALGSVPRSINDPVTTNEVNITGFLNVLVACREAGVKRLVYAASSSTYGDSAALPKVEDRIGKPLSPYAVTKYANELYAHVFGLNYGMDIIGLRYFNVFGRRQDPGGAYAAAIPRFVRQLLRHESPVIFGDGSTTRDFTYIDNVLLMNHLAATTDRKDAVGEVFNTAAGESTDLNTAVALLKEFLSEQDPAIRNIPVIYEPARQGDIRHSLASIEKAGRILGYKPSHTFGQGLKLAVKWYLENPG